MKQVCIVTVFFLLCWVALTNETSCDRPDDWQDELDGVWNETYCHEEESIHEAFIHELMKDSMHHLIGLPDDFHQYDYDRNHFNTVPILPSMPSPDIPKETTPHGMEIRIGEFKLKFPEDWIELERKVTQLQQDIALLKQAEVQRQMIHLMNRMFDLLMKPKDHK